MDRPLPPLVYAAQLAWNGKQLEDGQVADATNRLVFGCAPESPAEIILEIGKLDEIVGARLPQHQFAWYVVFEPKEDKLEKYLDEKLDRRQIERGLSFLLEIPKETPRQVKVAPGKLVDRRGKTWGSTFRFSPSRKPCGLFGGMGRESLPTRNRSLKNTNHSGLPEHARADYPESLKLLKEALSQDL